MGSTSDIDSTVIDLFLKVHDIDREHVAPPRYLHLNAELRAEGTTLLPVDPPGGDLTPPASPGKLFIDRLPYYFRPVCVPSLLNDQFEAGNGSFCFVQKG